MTKVIKLTETQLNNIIKRVLKEQRYSPEKDVESGKFEKNRKGQLYTKEIRKRK